MHYHSCTYTFSCLTFERLCHVFYIHKVLVLKNVQAVLMVIYQEENEKKKIIKPAVLVKYFKITHFYVVNFTCLVLIFQVRHTQSTFNTLEIDLIPFSDRYTLQVHVLFTYVWCTKYWHNWNWQKIKFFESTLHSFLVLDLWSILSSFSLLHYTIKIIILVGSEILKTKKHQRIIKFRKTYWHSDSCKI